MAVAGHAPSSGEGPGQHGLDPGGVQRGSAVQGREEPGAVILPIKELGALPGPPKLGKELKALWPLP